MFGSIQLDMNKRTQSTTPSNAPFLSSLVTKTLHGLSPIQTIMKIAEPDHIRKMGIDPKHLISFGGGWCNHPAPRTLQRIYQQICSDPSLFHQSGRYSPITGQTFCREQLAFFEQEIYNVSSLAADNIILGHSSTQLFHDLLRVCANPGDAICLLDPTYANYHNAIRCALPGSPIHYISALNPETWTYLDQPDQSLDQIKNYCSQGAKLFILPIPDNPTSQIPPESFLRAAQQILADHHGFLILDFAYKALWFEEMPACYSWSPENYENVISIHSNSKWLSSLGRRLGWIEASKEIISGLEKLNESVLLSPDTLHSMATARFLKQCILDNTLSAYITQIRTLYQSTAALMTDLIEKDLGWPYLSPKGGLYTCCPIPNKEESLPFIQRVLKHTGVLLIPGDGFGPSMKHAIRLSYGPLCMDHDLIKEGIQRIAAYL